MNNDIEALRLAVRQVLDQIERYDLETMRTTIRDLQIKVDRLETLVTPLEQPGD